jgi:hypothetical protein
MRPQSAGQDRVHGVRSNLNVGRDESQFERSCLSHEQPIERVSMQTR